MVSMSLDVLEGLYPVEYDWKSELFVALKDTFSELTDGSIIQAIVSADIYNGLPFYIAEERAIAYFEKAT